MSMNAEIGGESTLEGYANMVFVPSATSYPWIEVYLSGISRRPFILLNGDR